MQLDCFAALSDDDQLDSLVFERMLAGLATRRHRAANEPVGAAVEAAATSTSKSAVSRRFVRATARELDELLARDLSELDTVALMIDGIHFAEHCCVVAQAISADGTKTPVGLWLGDTENKRVATDLLADLVARGPSADDGLLVVIDGRVVRCAPPWTASSATARWCSAAPCIYADLRVMPTLVA